MDRVLTTPEDLLPRIEAKDTTITRQEIFEAVCVHLSRQKKAALSADGQCLYRAPDGTKCAVGCLIPDNLYSSDMEHRSFDALTEMYNEKHDSSLDALRVHHRLFEALQTVHDYDIRKKLDPRMRLIGIAVQLELDASFLTNMTFS